MKVKFNFILLVFFLMSCISPPEAVEIFPCDDTDIDRVQATFDVGEVKADIINLPSKGVLPSRFTLSFTACMADDLLVSKPPLTGVDFKILTYNPFSKEDQKDNPLVKGFMIPGDSGQKQYAVIQTKTDASGCVKWKETYNYDMPIKNRWIYFERVFENLGGQVVVPLLVNPWLHPDDGSVKLYDIRPSYNTEKQIAQSAYRMKEDTNVSQKSKENAVKKCLMNRSLSQIFDHLKDKGRARLHAKDISTVITFPKKPPKTLYEIKAGGNQVCSVGQTPQVCDARGVFLNLRLSIPLKIKFENSLNGNRIINIKQGQFEVTPMFVAHLNEQIYRIHRNVKPAIGEISADGEDLEVEFPYIHILPDSTSAQFELYLKITAVGENAENIKPFYRIYSIPGLNIESLAGSHNWGEKSVSEHDHKIVGHLSDVQNLGLSKGTVKKIKDNEFFTQSFQQIYLTNTGQDKFDELNPPTASGFHKSGKPALELKRLRFFKVFQDPEKGICESIVKREVLYTGIITVQDYKKPGNANLINESVQITVEDYTLDDNNNVVCVKDSIVPRKAETAPCKEPEEVSSQLDRTNEAGELQFYYKFEHKLYDRQKFYLKKFTFRVEGYRPQTKVFAFLPWEYGFLTYQDVTPKFEQLEMCQKERTGCDDESYISLQQIINTGGFRNPVLRFNEYRSILIEPSYEIQNSLDINTVKNSMVLIRPTIARFDNQGRTIRVAPLPLPRGYWILRMILLKGPQETHDGKENIVSPERQEDILLEDFKRNLKSSVQNLFQKTRYSDMYDQYVSEMGSIKEQAGGQNPDYTLNQNIFDVFENSLKQLSSEFKNLIRENRDHQTLETKVNSENFYELGNCISPSLSPNCREKPFSKSDYISHFDTLVYSDNSVISAFLNVKFKTEQFRFLGSKNVIMIQLYPTDPAGYKYKPGTCDINVEDSTFKPFTHHDLETPVHWGLYSSSDHGYFNTVRPANESLLNELIQSPENKEAPIPPLEDVELSEEEKELVQKGSRVLQTAFDGLEELRNIFEQDPEKFSADDNIIYMTMNQIGDDFNQYCSNTSDPFSYIQSCVCLGDQTPIEAKVRSCVQELKKQMGVNALIREELDEFQDHYYGRIKAEAVALNENSKKQYCDNPSKQFVNGYDGEIDMSQESVEFRKCICEDSTEDSLTLTMAKCFAQNQGLTVVDISKDNHFLNSLNRVQAFKEYNSDLNGSLWGVQEESPEEDSWIPDVVLAVVNWIFDDEEEQIEQGIEEKSVWNYMNYTSAVLESDKNVAEKLKNMPPVSQISSVNLSRFIREGFNENNVDRQEEGSFLHLMCYFWFDQYYEKFFDSKRINNLYQFYQRNDKLLDGQGLNPEGFSAPTENFLNTLELNSNKLNQNPFSEPNINVSLPVPMITPLQLFETSVRPNEHPYYRCLKNPRYFFQFERKVMVGQLSQRPEDFEYHQGHVYTYAASRVDGADLRRGWNLRHSFSLSSELKASLQGTIFGAGLRTSAEKSISDSEDRTQRASETSSKMVTLAVNNIKVRMGFSRYRQCLLIRPKGAAFKGYDKDIWNSDLEDRFQESVTSAYPESAFEFVKFAYKHFGLLLCDDEVSTSDNPLLVDEDYYYIHQFWGGHYEFMSRTLYHNRPYIQILRGKGALDKFEMLTKTDDYKLWTGKPPGNLHQEQGNVDIHLISAFNDTKLDHSGFVEGIYTYTVPDDHYLLSKDHLETESDWFTDIVEGGLSWFKNWFNLSDDREITEED